MFRTEKQIELELANMPIVLDVARLKHTQFQFRIGVDTEYPNGDYLDIYLAQIEGISSLSDIGDLYRYFEQTGDDFLNYWNEEKAQFIQSATGVLFTGSGMEFTFKEDKHLGKSLMRFIQAFELFWELKKQI